MEKSNFPRIHCTSLACVETNLGVGLNYIANLPGCNHFIACLYFTYKFYVNWTSSESPSFNSFAVIICNVMDLNSLVIFQCLTTSCYFVIICNIVVALNTLIIFSSHWYNTSYYSTIIYNVIGTIKPWS